MTPAPEPGGGETSEADGPAPVIYVVREGDTLETISRLFMVSVESLRRINSLGENADVRAGQRIQVPLSE